MALQALDLLLFAIAALIIYRLIYALGRNPGDDKPTQPPFSHRESERHDTAQGRDGRDGNVIPLPGAKSTADAPEEAPAPNQAIIERLAPKGSALAEGLTEIQMADRTFEPQHFVTGARSAYEMIVGAFAAGDRKQLKPLLAEDVYDSFEQAVSDRESKGNSIETNFVGIEKADIVQATLKDKVAEITVKFVSEIISVTKNADGAVIEGDPVTVKKITDVWTFARNTASRDPNWKLIGTAAG